MILKALELLGFKSFPDKTRLTFDKGMTAVVGPNGSGKSNIGDALLWVLGEQSSKNLRGDKMEDVIFSGSQDRKSVNIAKVSLFLDNLDREIEIDSDDVVIQRKLYRSGESEYKINGRNVRLKDIYELFMDTGIGKNGYSMVGQGKIAEIISSKATDRREIFEEAAGISKFKYRKKEAERQLLKTEENLNRALDIKLELDERIEPLRVESDKANKFLKLSEEKKTLEISLWIDDLNKININLQKDNKEVDYLSIDINNLQKKIAEKEKSSEDIFNKSNLLSMEITEKNQNIREIEEQLNKSISRIAVLENDIGHNNKDLERLINQKQELTINNDKVNEDIDKEKKEIDDIKNFFDLKFAELEGLNKKVNEIFSFFSEDEKLKLDLQENINKKMLDLLNNKALINRCTEKIKDNEENLIKIKSNDLNTTKTIDNINKEIIELNKIIEKIKLDKDNNINIINGYKIKLDQKQNFYNELFNKQNILKNSVFQLKRRIETNESLVKNMDGIYSSVKAVIKAKENGLIRGVLGTVGELLDVKENLTLAIEIALGNSLQHILTKDDTSAKDAIKYLKKSNAGRATFLPVTNIKSNNKLDKHLLSEDDVIGVASDLVNFNEEYRHIFNILLGRVLIVKDIETANFIGKKHTFKFKIVTLDGQVVNAGGSFTGGSALKSSGILSRKTEITNMKNLLLKESEELENVDDNLNKETIVLDEIKNNINKINDVNDKIFFDIKSFENQLNIFNSNLDNIFNTKLNLDKQVLSLQNENENLEKQLNLNLKTSFDLSNEIDILKEKLINLDENYKVKILKKEECAENIKNLQIEIASLDKDINNKTFNLNKTIEYLKDTKSSIFTISKQINELEKLNLQLKNDIKTNGELIESFKVEKQTNKQDINDIITGKNNLEKTVVDIRKEIKVYSEKRENVLREKIRLEERKISTQEKYDLIIAKLWDDYELAKSDASKIAKTVDNIVLHKGRINEIKNKIKSMGNINVGAIEEYRVLKERYDFLAIHIDDVTKSKIEIKKLINEITDNMTQQFKNIFNEININFKRIFEELFGGGYGELILTDQEDILSSGVDINICPPGKNLRNISLLSGGEKSFVAIAIYFAIFNVKPSSFCILDEIEAALDDVNVIKFAKYIKKLSYNTQFIAVTHRRGTMEEADVLYGVTMQKEGVSKCIKLDSQRVDKSFI
ncbi:MAG: chromosome segregation protein SMC [Oscillospiraceae bacterium]